MSRTYRNPRVKKLCLRKPKTQQQVKILQKAQQEILELGFPCSNRTVARANTNNTIIPNSRDDIPVSALFEIDYANGRIWEEL